MLEHFPSWSAMIAFDVVFVLVAAVTTIFVILRYRQIRAARAQLGAGLVLAGIWLIAGLYGTDLFAMLVLPGVIGAERAMTFMRDIHISYAWYVTFIAEVAVVAGLGIIVNQLSRQHSETQAAVDELAREVEERSAIERELRESEQRYQQAAEVARLGYYIWDAVADCCIYCTETHASFHGLRPEEYIARASALDGSFELTPEADREKVRAAYTRLRSGQRITMEYYLHNGTRPLRIREVGHPIFDAGGRVVREIGTTLDITEQHEAEQQALRAQRLETIGQLSGGVAHDFNNLLAVILGNLELLDEIALTPEARESVASAIQAAHRGADLTQSLLSFARRADLQPEPVDLNKLVRDAQNWIGRTMPAMIQIETSLLARIWQVHVDRASVEAAFLNLIINARDAMPDGGKMTIETSNVRIENEREAVLDEDVPEGRYVLLAVSDTGSGIDPDNLDRIFEPFFSTKGEGIGSGLGLSTIQGFMAQSGGAVRVYSELGVGTTFKLYFRALNGPEDAASIPLPQDQDATSGTMRILLAEDQDEVRAVLHRQLELAGHDVVACASGDTAMAHFQSDQNFDLLVTDVVMPGRLQGPALAQELRQLKPSLQVIFVSGYANEATVHGNGLRPEDIRLMKPVRRHDLLAAIERVSRSIAGAEHTH
ncbi:MAG: ATP-binding protein [Pseudomonadota bacterium]